MKQETRQEERNERAESFFLKKSLVAFKGFRYNKIKNLNRHCHPTNQPHPSPPEMPWTQVSTRLNLIPFNGEVGVSNVLYPILRRGRMVRERERPIRKRPLMRTKHVSLLSIPSLLCLFSIHPFPIPLPSLSHYLKPG